MSNLELRNVTVSYDNNINVLVNYSLKINDGEFVSILGPSGCGKTTTLKSIIGLLDLSEGELIVGNEDFTKIPVNKRNFGIVFQSYALFPNMTVFGNVAYGLKIRKDDAITIEKKVLEMLEIVGLLELKNRKPKNLSGGQRQRVALARALVVKPKLLLLDEPLSNLDSKLRVEMRTQIKKIQQELKITTVLVTHDQEESFSISDKVAIMNNGRIEQHDTPENIYTSPNSEFIADFVGFKNFIRVTHNGENDYRMSNGELLIGNSKCIDATKVAIRPQFIETSDEDYNNIVGTISVRTYLGNEYQYEVDTDIGKLIVNLSESTIYENGDKIKLHLPKDKLILFSE